MPPLFFFIVFQFFIFNSKLYGLNLTVNTLRQRQNGRHFADDTFKRIFLNVNVIISIEISLKCVSKGPINKIPALVQMMAWRRPGDKPLSEPMMVRLLTHICVTRPQWVKHLLRLWRSHVLEFNHMSQHRCNEPWIWNMILKINWLRPSDAYMRQ